MKKIILLALTALMMVGCIKSEAKDNYVYDKEYVHSEIERYGCEYWIFKWGHQAIPVHKGNCRFCEERRKKELEELVIKLKEK